MRRSYQEPYLSTANLREVPLTALTAAVSRMIGLNIQLNVIIRGNIHSVLCSYCTFIVMKFNSRYFNITRLQGKKFNLCNKNCVQLNNLTLPIYQVPILHTFNNIRQIGFKMALYHAFLLAVWTKAQRQVCHNFTFHF